MFKTALKHLAYSPTCRFLLGAILMMGIGQASDLSDFTLTPEKFKALTDQMTPLEKHNLTPFQATLINSPDEKSYGFSPSLKDFSRALADIHFIDAPKSPKFCKNFLLDFMEENSPQNRIRGIIITTAQEYELSLTLTIFNDPNIKIKASTALHEPILSPDMLQEKTFMNLSDREALFMDQLKKLAGTVRCKWIQSGNKSLLTVNNLHVNPYNFGALGNIMIPALERQSKPIAYEGLYALDYETRLDKIETFLEWFAFEIAKVDEIRLIGKGLDMKAKEILSTDNENGIVYKLIENCKKGEEIYSAVSPVILTEANTTIKNDDVTFKVTFSGID